MTNTRVGTNIDSNSAGKSTSAITTVNVKDVVVLWVGVNTASITANSLASSRITWTKLGTWAAPSPMAFQQSLFIGIVNSVGSDTITATFSGAIGSTLVQWTGAQFHTDTGLDWQVDNAQVGTAQSTTAVTAMALPALTSTGSGRLGVGIMVPRFSGTNGATSGWTYPTADGFTDVWPYHLALGSGAWTPAAATCTSGQYLSAGAILVPAVTTDSGVVAGSAPQATGTLAATERDFGAVAGAAPKATGTLAATERDFGAMVGQTAHPIGVMLGTLAWAGAVNGKAPQAIGVLAGAVRDLAVLAGSAPRPVGNLFGGTVNAVLAGSAPRAVGRLRTIRTPLTAAPVDGVLAVLVQGLHAGGGDVIAELESGPAATGAVVLA